MTEAARRVLLALLLVAVMVVLLKVAAGAPSVYPYEGWLTR